MDAFNRPFSHPRWPTADRNGREVAQPVRQVADVMSISFIADCRLEAPRSGSVIPPLGRVCPAFKALMASSRMDGPRPRLTAGGFRCLAACAAASVAQARH